MTLKLSDFTAPLSSRVYAQPAPKPAPAKKAKRKLKRAGWVVAMMPRDKWVTAAQVAALCKATRPQTHPHLFYAAKVGTVERKRMGECPCCGKPVVLWRRVA